MVQVLSLFLALSSVVSSGAEESCVGPICQHLDDELSHLLQFRSTETKQQSLVSQPGDYCGGKSNGDYCDGDVMITCNAGSKYKETQCSSLTSQPSGARQTCIQDTTGSYYNAHCGGEGDGEGDGDYCGGKSNGDYCDGDVMITCNAGSKYKETQCSSLTSQPSGARQTCIQDTTGSYNNAHCGGGGELSHLLQFRSTETKQQSLVSQQGVCDTYTGGTCVMSGCDSSRNAYCDFKLQCVCDSGFCHNGNGQCVRTGDYCGGKSNGNYCNGDVMITCNAGSKYEETQCSSLTSQPSGARQTCIQDTTGSYYNAHCGSK